LKASAASKFANSVPPELSAVTDASTPVVTLLFAWNSIVAVPDAVLVGAVTLTSIAVKPVAPVDTDPMLRGSPLLKEYVRRTFCMLFGTAATCVPLSTNAAVFGLGFTAYA
jgi:hypothetical protein